MAEQPHETIEAFAHETGQERIDLQHQVESLSQCIQDISKRGTLGLNQDDDCLQFLHMHAQIAWQWTVCRPFMSAHYHIFTDGSCKDGRASWACLVIQEHCNKGCTSFSRAGYAGGMVDELVGPCDATSMDAEATAIIAAAEIAISLCHISNVSITFHFDANVIGHGAFGHFKIPTIQGSESRRQKDARILMQILEAKCQ